MIAMHIDIHQRERQYLYQREKVGHIEQTSDIDGDGPHIECEHVGILHQWEGTLAENCPEGDLAWVKKEKVPALPLWEGDRIFLRLLEEAHPFFSLKLVYEGDHLIRAVLDGKELPR